MFSFKEPVQRLNFNVSRDSDDGDESSGYHSLDSSNSALNVSDENRDVLFDCSPDCWSPGLATPKGSPKQTFRRTRRSDSPKVGPNVNMTLDFGYEGSPSPDVVSPGIDTRSGLPTSKRYVSDSHRSSHHGGDQANGTPPHRRLKNLCLFDSPQTPKSLLQQQEQKSSERRRNRNIAGRLFSAGSRNQDMKAATAPRTRRRAAANVNPFTPQVVLNRGGTAKKRQRPERKYDNW